MIWWKTAAFLLIAGLVSGCVSSASVGTKDVYLYDDGPNKYSAMLNDIVIWKDPQSAVSFNNKFNDKNIRKVACISKPRYRAKVLAAAGNALEVKVVLACRGFVSKIFAHETKRK
ncbi:hypothetical protein [Hoeflea sp.]|uniref:hypothetical protein n=1 Tax=Hoeflea sp. TaxID=1940281 RepID=UPI00374A943B